MNEITSSHQPQRGYRRSTERRPMLDPMSMPDRRGYALVEHAPLGVLFINVGWSEKELAGASTRL